MSLQDLPLELLLEIAKLHPGVGCELSKVIKKVGLYSLENDMKRFYKVEENKETFILVKSSEEPYYKKLRHSWDDNPATSNGKQLWYKEGNIHRDDDKPARIRFNGSQQWYKNGKLHREDDKPAVISHYGHSAWYKEGDRYWIE